MVKIILITLVVLWLIGFIQIPILNNLILPAFRHPFTLYNILLLILILWLIGLLPGIFRTIVTIILVIWLLSIFGVFAIAGLSNLLIILLILAVIFSFL